MSKGVAAAITGDEAKAAAFWDGVARLMADWKMEKADLCRFMCNSVAAAVSGDYAKATDFWKGLAKRPRSNFKISPRSSFGGIPITSISFRKHYSFS